VCASHNFQDISRHSGDDDKEKNNDSQRDFFVVLKSLYKKIIYAYFLLYIKKCVLKDLKKFKS